MQTNVIPLLLKYIWLTFRNWLIYSCYSAYKSAVVDTWFIGTI